MPERRTAQRFRTNLNARWETLGSQGRGGVSDLSSTGCFVLSGANLSPGEFMRLQLVASDQIVSLWGHVVYSVNEIGFAVRFVFGNEADKRSLERLIEFVRDS